MNHSCFVSQALHIWICAAAFKKVNKAAVKEAWRRSGICPLSKEVIDEMPGASPRPPRANSQRIGFAATVRKLRAVCLKSKDDERLVNAVARSVLETQAKVPCSYVLQHISRTQPEVEVARKEQARRNKEKEERRKIEQRRISHRSREQWR